MPKTEKKIGKKRTKKIKFSFKLALVQIKSTEFIKTQFKLLLTEKKILALIFVNLFFPEHSENRNVTDLPPLKEISSPRFRLTKENGIRLASSLT